MLRPLPAGRLTWPPHWPLRLGAGLIILHACGPAAGYPPQGTADKAQAEAERFVTELALQFHTLGALTTDAG
jgi:hypothetical protein